MATSPTIDKTGSELNEQRFKLLQDIARELSEETTFPTSFDLVVRLRTALQDPDRTIDEIATLISMEPLIPLRLIQLANSAMYSRGTEVKDARAAIHRLGMNTVRSTAMAIAMSQLLRSKDLLIYGDVPQKLWDHSLRTACAAFVISKRVTRFNAEEAMLAGLVHDLGAFYLLYRLSQNEELRIRPDSAKYLIARWHESIGHTLLLALGIPQEIAESVFDHDTPRPVPVKPLNLSDVVYVSNMLAGGCGQWLGISTDNDAETRAIEDANQIFEDFLDDIDIYEKEMRALLA